MELDGQNADPQKSNLRLVADNTNILQSTPEEFLKLAVQLKSSLCNSLYPALSQQLHLLLCTVNEIVETELITIKLLDDAIALLNTGKDGG